MFFRSCSSVECTVAQTVTGSIRGTVTDASGAVVAGANVTATNVATGVAKQTVTNSCGLYNFQFLNLGDYTIAVIGERIYHHLHCDRFDCRSTRSQTLM